jgi:hypothetical protein
MMTLTLIPQWGRPETALSVSGDVLTRGTETYDLSSIPDGGEGRPPLPEPGEDLVFVGPIRRIDGVIHAALIVHLDDDAPQDQPGAPWVVAAGDGPVTIPAIRKPVEVLEPLEDEE